MCQKHRKRYSVRVPFPDEDKYCFVLDNQGKVSYYEHRADAEEMARHYQDATIVETQYYGF